MDKQDFDASSRAGYEDSIHAVMQKDADTIVGRLTNTSETIDRTLESSTAQLLDERVWARAPYRPTPTIVEAARALYAQHSVDAISRNDAGAKNLRITSRRIEELVDEAKSTNRKLICFVTGVPGAGKTLVGLNIATRRRESDQPTHAVFLSGNGP